jgi:hypothetical protein|tara:strand:+ start:238 stop:585 length:348 start_codon:yes stop_codon:yes gene_type:complete
VLLPRPIRSVAESDEAYELPSVMAGHRLTKDQEDYLEALSTFIEQYENKADPEPKKKTPYSRDSPVSLPGERKERCRLGTVAGGGPNSGNTHPARRTKPDGVAHSKNLQTVQAIG